MVTLIVMAGVLAMAAPPPAPPTPAQSVARARAAMSLSGVRIPAPGTCGLCRDDEPACAAESLGSGRPMVLFVGTCKGMGAAVCESGGIACRVTFSSLDGLGDAPRVLVVRRAAWKLVVVATLPADTPTGDIMAAVRLAAGTGPQLDWR